MNYVEEELSAALRERAGGEVDPQALLAGSLARGGARVRRRRLFTAAGVAGTTAAVLVAVSLGLGGGREAPPAGAGRYSVPAATSDVPGAQQQPESVGTDPFTIHFGLDAVPKPISRAVWESQSNVGVESLVLDFGPPGGERPMVWLSVARHDLPPDTSNMIKPSVISTATTVNGRAATLESRTFPDRVEWGLWWEQVKGVQARLHSTGLSKADTLAVAYALRFDRSSRCSVPLRLTVLPPFAAVTGCSVAYSDGHASASLTAVAGGSVAGIDAVPGSDVFANIQPRPETTRLPNGWTAGWYDDTYFLQGSLLEVTLSAGEPWGRADLIAVAEGMSQAGEPDKPDTWPVDPLI